VKLCGKISSKHLSIKFKEVNANFGSSSNSPFSKLFLKLVLN
jgi:hypothetical protein